VQTQVVGLLRTFFCGQGGFFECSDPAFPPGANLFDGSHACNGTISIPGYYNFNNVAQGMVSVFLMATQNGYSSLVYAVTNVSPAALPPGDERASCRLLTPRCPRQFMGAGLQPKYMGNFFLGSLFIYIGVTFFA
jgi:hypothetical protein